jgi:hypothetical protein
MAGSHHNRPAFVDGQHRLFGVDEEIEQHLLDLMRIGKYARHVGRQLGGDRQHRHLVVAAQRDRFDDERIDVDHGARRLALTRECQQVAHDTRGAVRFAEDDRHAALRHLVERLFRQPLRPAQDGRQRVVQLVRDAGDGLPERRHLLGLQDLLIDVLGLIVRPLAFADVAHQRFHPQQPAIARAPGTCRHLHPHRGAIQAAHPEEIVRDGQIVEELCNERGSRIGVDEPLRGKGHHLGLRGVRRVSKQLFQVGIGRERRVRELDARGRDRPDEHAFADGLEEPRERICTGFRSRGRGVSVDS